MANILFFGDSITFGAWDDEGGWVNRIKKHVHKKITATQFEYYHNIYNLGVPGDNTISLLERFEQELRPRAVDDEITDLVVVFAIGINDSQVYKNNKETRVPFEQFQQNLQKLYDQANKFKAKVVFIGLTPANESLVDPIPWTPEKSYLNTSIKTFNEEIKNFCNEKHLTFLNVFDEWFQAEYQTLLIDGLHPNTEGHEELYKRIKKILEEEKII